MTTQGVILQAVRSSALHLARLKNATRAFFNSLLGRQRIADNPLEGGRPAVIVYFGLVGFFS
jgi:hypothetical protein